MRIYQCSGHLFTVTQRKVSVIKHRCLCSFHTQLILLAGVRAESRDGRTAVVADFYTLISTYQRNSQQNCRFGFSRSLPYLENTSPYLVKHQLNLLLRRLNNEMRHKCLSHGKKSSKCTERKRFYFKTKRVNLSNERILISQKDEEIISSYWRQNFQRLFAVL